MNKKKWLLIMLIGASIGYLVFHVYHYNLIPQFTGLINIGLAYLQGGFNANPLGILAVAGSAITGLTTAAKLMWDRAKSGLESSLGSVIGDKDRQLTTLSNQYNTIKTEAATLQGQLTAVQSELQTVKTTLATTQTNLADAISQLQRKQDEITAITNIKAAELKTANSIVTIDSVLHELGSNVDPGAAARILTGKGITVTVP